MLRRLYDWTISLAARKTAEIWLAVIAFIESSFFLVPADVLFLPMALARPDRAYRLAFIATLASTLGGIAGYFLGYFAYQTLAQPMLDFYGKLEAFESLRACTDENTIALLLVTSGLAHLPPIKIVTILAGVVHASFVVFVALLHPRPRRALLRAGLGLEKIWRAHPYIYREPPGPYCRSSCRRTYWPLFPSKIFQRIRNGNDMLEKLDPQKASLAIFVVATATIGAWIFQLAGYDPCPLCLQQRWAYYFAVPFSLLCQSAPQPIPRAQGAGFIFSQSSCSAAPFLAPTTPALNGSGGRDPTPAAAISPAVFPISASRSLPAMKPHSAFSEFHLPDGMR